MRHPYMPASARIVLWILAVPLLCSFTPQTVEANEAEIRLIVDAGALAESPNSILLDYLLNEGKNALSPELQEQAVNQMVEALRTQTLVDPLEGMDQLSTLR